MTTCRPHASPEVDWSSVTALLLARCTAVGPNRSLPVGVMRDRLTEAAASDLSAVEYAATYGLTGEPVRPRQWLRPEQMKPTVGMLLAAGWTPHTYARLREIARLMSQSGGGKTPGWRRSTLTGLTWHLATLAERTPGDGARWVEVEPWLILLANAKDDTDADALAEMLYNWGFPVRNLRGLHPEASKAGVSLAGLTERVGPYAGWVVAAGMPLEEAEALHAAGTLEPDGLRVLAALHDYTVL